MSHKRVVLIVSYEGIDSWVDMMLRNAPTGRNRTLWAKAGTMKELQRIELGEGDKLIGLDGVRKETQA